MTWNEEDGSRCRRSAAMIHVPCPAPALYPAVEVEERDGATYFSDARAGNLDLRRKRMTEAVKTTIVKPFTRDLLCQGRPPFSATILLTLPICRQTSPPPTPSLRPTISRQPRFLKRSRNHHQLSRRVPKLPRSCQRIKPKLMIRHPNSDLPLKNRPWRHLAHLPVNKRSDSPEPETAAHFPFPPAVLTRDGCPDEKNPSNK